MPSLETRPTGSSPATDWPRRRGTSSRPRASPPSATDCPPTSSSFRSHRSGCHHRPAPRRVRSRGRSPGPSSGRPSRTAGPRRVRSGRTSPRPAPGPALADGHGAGGSGPQQPCCSSPRSPPAAADRHAGARVGGPVSGAIRGRGRRARWAPGDGALRVGIATASSPATAGRPSTGSRASSTPAGPPSANPTPATSGRRRRRERAADLGAGDQRRPLRGAPGRPGHRRRVTGRRRGHGDRRGHRLVALRRRRGASTASAQAEISPWLGADDLAVAFEELVPAEPGPGGWGTPPARSVHRTTRRQPAPRSPATTRPASTSSSSSTPIPTPWPLDRLPRHAGRARGHGGFTRSRRLVPAEPAGRQPCVGGLGLRRAGPAAHGDLHRSGRTTPSRTSTRRGSSKRPGDRSSQARGLGTGTQTCRSGRPSGVASPAIEPVRSRGSSPWATSPRTTLTTP